MTEEPPVETPARKDTRTRNAFDYVFPCGFCDADGVRDPITTQMKWTIVVRWTMILIFLALTGGAIQIRYILPYGFKNETSLKICNEASFAMAVLAVAAARITLGMDTLYANYHFDDGTIQRRKAARQAGRTAVDEKAKIYGTLRWNIVKRALQRDMLKDIEST